jgi:hypothetical protein
MTGALSTLLLVFATALLAVAVLYVRSKKQSAKALARYSRISDLEAEQVRLGDENRRLGEDIARTQQRAEQEHGALIQRYRELQSDFQKSEETKRQNLEAEYQSALARYRELQDEIKESEESLEDISSGVYEPHFTYQTPEEYKARLTELRHQQRDIVRKGRATNCPIEWTVNNSKVEGKRMIRLNSKLLLRAFNGECEAAIGNLTWNNAQRMERRVRKSFADINKMGLVQHITVTDLYLMLKIEELRMVKELEQKRYEEREEQRRVREQIREEKRTQQEIEQTIQESLSDEEKYAAALDRARNEVAQAMGAKLEGLTEQIGRFEAKLDEARRKKERAIARAQLTKSGFVYVISNIGSFGETVYKIGMTRRLEPMDRIYELSGAAVPFPYDLHAMLYSDDAPALEYAMHQLFRDRRLNMVNARREFFRDVELREIEEFVKERGLSAQFLAVPEAREYRQTLTMRQRVQAVSIETKVNFPEQLFS